jgi:hypothetical protein
VSDMRSIAELQAMAKKIDAQHWELQYWPNGIYFVESPSGEGTEVPEEAVAGALAELFRIFF